MNQIVLCVLLSASLLGCGERGFKDKFYIVQSVSLPNSSGIYTIRTSLKEGRNFAWDTTASCHAKDSIQIIKDFLYKRAADLKEVLIDLNNDQ